MHSLSSDKSQSWLSWSLRGVLILLFMVLIAKLIEVQVIKGSYFRNLSEENRIRRVVIPAPRGKILARGGEILTGNTEIKKRIEFTDTGGFTLSEDLTGAAEEEVITDYKRYYPMGDKFSHALGYLARVGENEVDKINPDCPEKGPISSDSLIGKTGLEEKYECLLSGTPGEEIIEVDASGYELRMLGKKDPVPGQDLQTTIDYGLQTEIANEMNGKKGAAIVTDTTGRILAFYSYPSFDPNIFINKGNNNEISSLLNDDNLPFFNRVISGTFHPGSVFKPLVSITALEEGAIDKNFIYNDQGVITINNYSYSNWYFSEYGRTEGSIDLTKAIARSTDTFFYTIGQMVGPDAIAKWANTFGLDSQTGIDISGEVKGLIPTPSWKELTKNEPWFLGNTYHMSIGQGDVSVTPAEINRLNVKK
ncbi:MAG: Penicillin-binding protein 2 [Candidatus Woesebacteria bacterium GW2011_GWA1_40_43]|uniref:Penicillin-binding protein 2 n=1 Tax=Candidatus Woesebacteria bacterium GW2011_GWA1_40_43 TaxID=1618553 RepID=A0A0G0UU38_9BACT|nr:MAG: Penicillin-binding protein 2 [Candidatus Woesebacteria bacterium GW2011_GWA1_40_43]